MISFERSAISVLLESPLAEAGMDIGILADAGLAQGPGCRASRHFVFDGIRSAAGGAGEVVIASSTLTLSPAFTPSSAVGGKWSFIEPSGVFTSIQPRFASTLVTLPSIVWRAALATAGA